MPNREPKTVVIAEQPGLLRDGIASLCAASGRYRVAAAVECGEEAWRLIEKLRPDAALVDLQTPRLDALDIARRLSGMTPWPDCPPTRCVILSLRSDRKTVLEVLRAGAQGFLLKSSSGDNLLDCLDRVLDGGIYVSPGVDLQNLFSADRRGVPDDPLDTLSPREFQVFSLLVEGVRPKEIAARLGVSPKTVDTYRVQLMRKLGIHDVPGLVKYAVQRGFIPLAGSAAGGAG
jgi:DNA-binding NarL/FixJ family response regulator